MTERRRSDDSTHTEPPATTMPSCYLHIGTMKSGTTFLQQMLGHHRAPLGERGVLFPGRGSYGKQINAVRDVLDLPGTVPRAKLVGAWDGVLAEIADWSGGTSVISVEQLSIATTRQVARVVESLAPADVHVVLTARDLARVLPSTWQENVQNGLSWTWPDFVASVMGAQGADPTPGTRFWRQHDIGRIARRWGSVVGVDHVHLVTLPPSGAPPDLLWQRFCGVLGIDPGVVPVEGTDLKSNRGLDRVSAEMLRRVNALLGDDLDRAARQRILKRGLAKSSLVQSAQQLPIVLDAEQYAWARRSGEQLVDDLVASEVLVAGDLRELVPPERSDVPTAHLREPSEAEITNAACAAAAELLIQVGMTGSAPRRRRRKAR